MPETNHTLKACVFSEQVIAWGKYELSASMMIDSLRVNYQSQLIRSSQSCGVNLYPALVIH